MSSTLVFPLWHFQLWQLLLKRSKHCIHYKAQPSLWRQKDFHPSPSQLCCELAVLGQVMVSEPQFPHL